MAIRANYPDIKPSLNLDFANTKQLDPRITFTRTTTATYYDGKTVAKAEENLLLQSQSLDNASWSKTTTTVTANNATAPDGTATAETLLATGANSTVLQTVTTVAGDYTFSVWLRRVAGTGNVDITAHSGGTWVTQTITSSWARYTVTQTLTAGSRTPGIRLVTDTDSVEAWGAQLEQRSSVTAYTATTTQPITNYIPVLQTAAAGQARFDHNPTTGESLGLLIEEQRTNIFVQSEGFSTGSWGKESSTVTANAVVAPDGTLTADIMVPNSAATSADVYQGVSVTSGTAYTLSFYAKAYGLTQVLGYFTSTDKATFDLSAGTATTAGSVTATITSIGNGWYRCVTTRTAPATTPVNYFILWSGSAANGFSGISIWGAQFEAGSFATSYIPTTTASVTRNADVASMTGTNFSSWYNIGSGTLYAENILPALGATVIDTRLQRSGASSDTNVIYLGFGDNVGSGSGSYGVINNSVTGAASTYSGLTGTTTRKKILAYTNGDQRAAVNGTLLTATTLAATDSNLIDGIYFGRRAAGSSLNAQWIKKVAYYPKRVSDAELQALTTV